MICGSIALSLAACRARPDTPDPGADSSETTIATLELSPDSPLDSELQTALENADRETASALGIPPEARAFGAVAAHLAEHLPCAVQVTIPGAGHCAHLEQPARVAEAIRMFLADCRRSGGSTP